MNYPKMEMWEKYDLNGKTILVNGASSGLGKSISDFLLKRGCYVTITSSNKEKLEKAYEELKTTLNSAKSRASSQRKPVACTGTLSGYQVFIEQERNKYHLRAVCPNLVSLNTVPLPQNIIFDSGPTFFFPTLIGGATGGTVTLTGYNKNKTITVDSDGNIK